MNKKVLNKPLQQKQTKTPSETPIMHSKIPYVKELSEIISKVLKSDQIIITMNCEHKNSTTPKMGYNLISYK